MVTSSCRIISIIFLAANCRIGMIVAPFIRGRNMQLEKTIGMVKWHNAQESIFMCYTKCLRNILRTNYKIGVSSRNDFGRPSRAGKCSEKNVAVKSATP